MFSAVGFHEAGRSANACAGGPRSVYLTQLRNFLWPWADVHHHGELDGHPDCRRPPVLQSADAHLNVLTPPAASPEITQAIRDAIPPSRRHKHFASLLSSQALTQSVFASLEALDRLGALAGLEAECGSPAFFDRAEPWSLELEREVRLPGEPRPTTLDVLLHAPDGKQIAVECKLSENEFGTCSRARLHPCDSSFDSRFCDGTYTHQAGRKERCALTAAADRLLESAA